MKKILSLLAAGAIALAASGQQNLTPEVLSSLKQSYAGNSADRARQSVVSNGSFRLKLTKETAHLVTHVAGRVLVVDEGDVLSPLYQA